MLLGRVPTNSCLGAAEQENARSARALGSGPCRLADCSLLNILYGANNGE